MDTNEQNVENKDLQAAANAEGKIEGTQPEEKTVALRGKGLEKMLPLVEQSYIKPVEMKITFKTVKEIDSEGKPTGADTKREGFNVVFPRVTFEGLLIALQDPKQRDYILDLVNDGVYSQLRSDLNDAPTIKDADEIDLSRLTLEFIANIPAGERRGGGIAKETWDDFVRDYVEVMSVLQSDKQPDKIANAATMFSKRLQSVKTNKQVLPVLQSYLAMWFQNSKKAEDFQAVFEFLNEKVESFMKKDEASLLESL